MKQGTVETTQGYADHISMKHSDVAMVAVEVVAADIVVVVVIFVVAVVYLCSTIMDTETFNILFLCNKHTHQ